MNASKHRAARAQFKRDFRVTMDWAKLSPASESMALASAARSEDRSAACYRAIANSLSWEQEDGVMVPREPTDKIIQAIRAVKLTDYSYCHGTDMSKIDGFRVEHINEISASDIYCAAIAAERGEGK